MVNIWNLTQAEFLGDYPIVDTDQELEDTFRQEIDWLTMSWLPDSLRPIRENFYLADIGDHPGGVALMRGKAGHYEVVGGYCDSVLWIAPEVRGKGFAVELVIAAAEKSGCRMDPVSYTLEGLRAHMAAHREAVRRALFSGKPVPQRVLADYPELLESLVITRDALTSSPA